MIHDVTYLVPIAPADRSATKRPTLVTDSSLAVHTHATDAVRELVLEAQPTEA